ncbi:response regulator [bacterium]|nr:response regulator [bacterium]
MQLANALKKVGSPMKLLIIDDQPQVTNSLKEAIEPGGHECVVFNQPQKAVSHFQNEYFDAVITDLKMPEMDGIQVLKMIQKNRPGTPVIILTGYADTQNAIEAVNLGAYGFFQKPVQIQELLESLKQIELKIQEDMLRDIRLNQLQAEKEKMSTELKERINQTLQLISSLLRMQYGKMENSQAKKALHSAYQRIHTMALIHERIYSEGHAAKLNLAEYIKRYMNTFSQINQLNEKNITIDLQLEPVTVDVNHAIPWGLVFNELIANAISHAFSDSNGNDNRIYVSLNRNKSNAITLKVSDNGKGIDQKINMDEYASLGMNLISNIVRYQLNGNIDIQSKSGTCIKIVSPS